MIEQHTSSAIMIWMLICAAFSFLARLLRCRHHWVEDYYDLSPDHDDPNGARTFHGIRWRCARCRSFSSASGHSR